MNLSTKCYLCKEVSIFNLTKRKCCVCNNSICKKCFVAEGNTGFCTRCYLVLEASPSKDTQKPSDEEIKYNQEKFLTLIEKSPYEFFEDRGCLGKGNFSTVYKVRSLSDQKEFALKKLNSGDQIEAFIEFSQTVLTSCSNLLPSFALYRSENSFYILQELMKCSLRDVICMKIQLNEDLILFILREITKGLAVLHDIFKIHRDIKTENIFLSLDGRIKIGDFGSVAQLTQENELRSTLIGTPLFLAPEIVQGLNYGLEVDIWSLGIIAHELLFQKTPFCNCTNIYDLGHQINNFKLESLAFSEYEKVDFFIRSCLKTDPSQRATAKDLLSNPLFMVSDLEYSKFLNKASEKTAVGRLLTPKTRNSFKERSASQSRLLLTAALLESKSATKGLKGCDIFPKSGSSTPRKLAPIADLQTYYKQIEDQEEKALVLILRELDGLASLHLS